MTVISVEALGVTSDGVASLLATVLAASPAPATLVLEKSTGTQIRIEVASRADRGAGPGDSPGQDDQAGLRRHHAACGAQQPSAVVPGPDRPGIEPVVLGGGQLAVGPAGPRGRVWRPD